VNIKTIGREAGCDLVLENTGGSRKHATLELLETGALWLTDNSSRNGTFLQRNGNWIGVSKVMLCVGDRIRFADSEMPMPQLTAAFGSRAKVQLGEKHFPLRQGAKAIAAWDHPGSSLQKPKRNPLTGKIEEER
jgi:hypothetical protein